LVGSHQRTQSISPEQKQPQPPGQEILTPPQEHSDIRNSVFALNTGCPE
jgi:hypothetical protein